MVFLGFPHGSWDHAVMFYKVLARDGGLSIAAVTPYYH